MRHKVYYTVDEITNNLYTEGLELMYPDGTNYRGLYHKYTTGEIYTRANWHPTLSKKLIPYEQIDDSMTFYKQEKKNIKTKYKSIESYNPVITLEDINKGFIRRYFVQNVTDLNITEVSPEMFLQYQQNLLDNNLYKALELPWIISGILQSETTNGVIVNGVYDKNKKTVEINNIEMPGLNSKLANLTEFYTDTTYIVPENINPQ